MKIKIETLYTLLLEGEYLGEYEGFKLIENEIYHADDEDGGGHYSYIIQDIETKKYYKGAYCDWDLSNTDYDEETNTCYGRIDLENDLTEVKPKTKTITITVYE